MWMPPARCDIVVRMFRVRSSAATSGQDSDLYVRLGQRERLVISQRYAMLSILNDFMVGAWFLVGSILFLDPASTEAGTWLFIIGSAQLLIRPCIHLARHIHLQRI